MKQTPNPKLRISKLLLWVAASFVAIAMVEANAVAGLAFALVSGVVLGLLVVLK